jgi:hypothetical protein
MAFPFFSKQDLEKQKYNSHFETQNISTSDTSTYRSGVSGFLSQKRHDKIWSHKNY